MKRVFYGVCVSLENEAAKRVIVSDTDLLQENFQFEVGDLLTVFFAQGNTAEEPTLVITTNDTEQNTSNSDDEGKLIKTHDATAEAVNAWGAGEAVTFVYVKDTFKTENNEQSVPNNIYYWEMVNAVHASKNVYGDTKLFDFNKEDNQTETEAFNNWIAAEEQAKDDEYALAPNALKKLMNLLEGSWEPAETPYELDTLGTLTLGQGNGISITYPINAIIDNKLSDIPRFTGQLQNNGNGPDNTPVAECEPFITRIVPNDLYFSDQKGLKYGDTSVNVPRIVLNGENNKLILGEPKPQEGVEPQIPFNGVVVNQGLTVDGDTIISGNGKATELFESNVALKNKYSPILRVYRVRDNTIATIKPHTTSKRNNSSHLRIDLSLTEWKDKTKYVANLNEKLNVNQYKPIGIVGYNVNYSTVTGKADAIYANVWECYLMPDSNIIEYSIYNIHDKDINVSIDIYILCQKII